MLIFEGKIEGVQLVLSIVVFILHNLENALKFKNKKPTCAFCFED